MVLMAAKISSTLNGGGNIPFKENKLYPMLPGLLPSTPREED